MKFGQLEYLSFLILIPILIVFFVWSLRSKKKALEKFVSTEMQKRLLIGWSPVRRNLKFFLIIAAIFFLVLALIRPKWGFHWEEVKRRGVDIVIALDVSKSMLAEDVSPNRLQRAKREIVDLLRLLKGDRVGLVAFAGVAFLQTPLTLDYGAINIFLDELDTELIPVGGTAIADAIDKSIGAFNVKDKKSRVIILITDGEDHLGSPIAASERAKKEGIKLYTIGIGKKEGALIPDKKTGGSKKDANGNLILSRLDEVTLQKMALKTGGAYVRSVSGDMDFEKIYADIQKKVEDKELKSGRRKRYEERYQWPLALAIILLIIELFLSERSSRHSRIRGSKLSVLILFGWGLIFSTNANSSIFNNEEKEGERAYKNKQYGKALKKFLNAQVDSPDKESLKFNTASSFYQAKEYDKAQKMFESLSHSTNSELAQKSTYNLGNISYRQGKLKKALEYYQQALKLNPKDQDAKKNLDFVRKEIKRRLEEQKKRQKKQQNQQQRQGQKRQQQKNQGPQDKKQEQKQSKGQQAQEKKRNNKNEKGQDKNRKDKEKKGKMEKDGKRAKEKKQQATQSKGGRPKKDRKQNLKEKQAQRWLDSLQENRKQYLKKKIRAEGGRHTDKDW